MMVVNSKSKYTVIGIMIVFGIVSAACSVGSPSAAEPDGAQLTKRDIKVYESPT